LSWILFLRRRAGGYENTRSACEGRKRHAVNAVSRCVLGGLSGAWTSRSGLAVGAVVDTARFPRTAK
jgi:hypothetical protein